LKEKASSVALLVMLLLGTLTLVFGIQLVCAEPDTIYVDDDNVAGPWDGSQLHPYQNITSGLENAASGDTIFVYNGTYHEHVSIEKSISLVGQNPLTTIIDGSGEESHPIVNVNNTSNVVINNLTVQNTTSSSESYGILIWQARNVTIQNNVVIRNYYNILLDNSTFCKILDNKIADSYNSGIVFRSGSSYNEIISNSIMENPNGIYIQAFSQNNTFYRNNIINNTRQVNIFPPAPSSWDNGVEGNYWSDYEGTDQDGDGIGDAGLLPHLGVDSYPLIEIWNKTRTYHVDPYEVVVNCNYTVASFKFNQTLRQISFYITGPSGWSGYCNVTIPKALLSPQNASEKWMVMLGSNPLTYTNKTFNNSTRISFKFTLGSSMSDNRVRVKAGSFYPPTAGFEFTPDPASIIEPVNFTDTSKDGLNGTIVWRQWNFGDGNITETNATFLSHQFESKTMFNVTLTVRDNNTLTDSVTKFVWVRNEDPFAGFTFLPTEPFAGLEVEFNASKSYDLDGNITDYRWDFGDGNIISTNDSIVVHMFEQVGKYLVNLTVCDNDREENSTVQTITVGKGLTEVGIDAPTTVKVEELFIVTATLLDYYASQPLSGEQIEFYVYDNNLVLSRNGTTDIDGMARAIFSLAISGNYSIEVKYKGSEDHLESNSTKLITVNSLTTNLTIQALKNATQNEESMMFATLLDENESPVHNATVEFYSYSGNIWKLLGSSKTNQSGVASFNYISQSVGTFMLKAVFNGTEMYAASNSGEYSFTVVASEIDYVPYIILAAAIAIVVCLMYIALKRRKTPSDVQPNDRETSSPS